MTGYGHSLTNFGDQRWVESALRLMMAPYVLPQVSLATESAGRFLDFMIHDLVKTRQATSLMATRIYIIIVEDLCREALCQMRDAANLPRTIFVVFQIHNDLLRSL
jgi:hypothetical protein